VTGPATPALAPAEPVRRAIRRLRWFRHSFLDHVARMEADTGVAFDRDDKALSACFIEWLRAFEAQKPGSAASRRDYVGFAAGLMLRALIDKAPLSVRSLPEGADTTHPGYFWPEGYVYVAYCLNIRAAVLEQDFHEARDTAPALSEIRSWWSFRENVAEDPELAVAFLDLFAGEAPDWEAPGIFRERSVALNAPRFYARTPLAEPPAANGD